MTIGLAGIALIVLLVVLLLAWRALKFFVRLALLGLAALLVVGLLVWWNLPGDSAPARNDSRPANTRRPTNR